MLGSLSTMFISLHKERQTLFLFNAHLYCDVVSNIFFSLPIVGVAYL